MGRPKKARAAGLATLGARSKRAAVVHTSNEYELLRATQRARMPRELVGGSGYTREMIRQARDAQMRAYFGPAKRLAAAQRTDDGLYAALRNRLAPTKGLPVALKSPSSGARAQRILDEAEGLFGQDGIAIAPDTMRSIHEELADHGVAFATCTMTPRPDGSRVDTMVNHWPIQFVRWDTHDRTFKTRTDNGGDETICHGDGRWIVFRVAETDPWLWGAVIATSAVWEDRAFGLRDRARASTSHGNAKMIGQLPPEVPIDSEEGRAYLLLLETMHEQLPYGIEPNGAKTQMLVNTSTSWQIFQEIVKGRLGDGARIYLGHDGSTSAVGGNYIKDGLLYGVTVNIVEDDLRALETGIYEGAIVPWCAINFGDSSLAPRRVYLMPDADADARDDSLIKRRKAFREDLLEAREAGILVDQAYVDSLAKAYRLEPVVLKSALPSAPAAGSPTGPAAAPSSPTSPLQTSP